MLETLVENAPLPNGDKSGPSGHKQQNSEPRKPPLPITSPKKPISQAEFQALLDAGYKVSEYVLLMTISTTLLTHTHYYA